MPTDLYRDAPSPFRQSIPVLMVNGKQAAGLPVKGFATVRRRWQKGDVVTLSMDMAIRNTIANDRVADDRGKFVIERGPLVYCLEGIDNGGKVLDVAVPPDTAWSHQFKADLLGGVEVITLTPPPSSSSPARALTAIPYYAWANRGRGEMAVWIPYK
jgi:DUF1680 family protein